MRTLIVIHSLKMGGMERMAVNLADAFAAAGHESHLLSCRAAPNDLRPSRPEVHVHHHDQLRARLASGVGIIPFLLSRLLLGVLVPKSHYIWVGWLDGWLLKRRIARLEKAHGRFDRIIFRGIGTFKYFWTFHDERNSYVLENILKRSGMRWLRRIEVRLLLAGRHLVCVSDGVRESLERRFDETDRRPASLRVINNPCPVEQIRLSMREADPEIPDEPYIVNVARLVPQKGHTRLLEAYAMANPAERLVIVGDGQERRRLEALAVRLGIADRVLFVGQKRNPYPWMHRARLFVLSSEFEGFGVVLTEALACGTLIVSVDCPGGVRDVFRGSLRDYLAEDSVAGLARKMSEVLARLPVEIEPQWLEPFQESRVVEAFLAAPARARLPGAGE